MLVTTASAFIRVFFGYFIDVGTLSIRSTSSYFHPLRNCTDCTKLTACTARLLLSAAHQASLPAGKLGAVGRAITSLARPLFRLPCASPLARSARRKTEADCMKINRLYGKALAVRCTFSSFHLP